MDKSFFNSSNKPNFLDFNIQEARGWIINEINFIEFKIDQIISEKVQPKDSKLFNVILNSSIISFGGKLKILRNLPDFDKSFIVKLQNISAIRNAFAHIPIKTIFNLEDIDANDNATKKLTKVTWQINVMNSEGLIKEKDSVEELRKFEVLKNEIIKYLRNYRSSYSK